MSHPAAGHHANRIALPRDDVERQCVAVDRSAAADQIPLGDHRLRGGGRQRHRAALLRREREVILIGQLPDQAVEVVAVAHHAHVGRRARIVRVRVGDDLAQGGFDVDEVVAAAGDRIGDDAGVVEQHVVDHRLIDVGHAHEVVGFADQHTGAGHIGRSHAGARGGGPIVGRAVEAEQRIGHGADDRFTRSDQDVIGALAETRSSPYPPNRRWRPARPRD